MTITLPANQPCSTATAPCSKTLDDKGRKPLSNSPTATAEGPVLVSIADAEGADGSNGAVVFIVSLSRAATGTLSVDYATQDGTALAGEDYTVVEGTLTFTEGQNTKTIAVPILDNDDSTDPETLTLTLTNAIVGYIGRGVTTGTIR